MVTVGAGAGAAVVTAGWAAEAAAVGAGVGVEGAAGVAAGMMTTTVGRCRLTLSNPMLKQCCISA